MFSSTDIVILDDPTSSLDNKVTSRILTRICTHPKWSQKTYIISTRKISVLKKMDKVIFIQNGKITFSGTFSQLKHKKEFIDFAHEEKVEKSKNSEQIQSIQQKENQDAPKTQNEGQKEASLAAPQRPRQENTQKIAQAQKQELLQEYATDDEEKITNQIQFEEVQEKSGIKKSLVND